MNEIKKVNEIKKFLRDEGRFFSQQTGDIEVAINPTLIHNANTSKKMWIYCVIFTNFGKETYKLLSRKWIVQENQSTPHEISGNGVVGQNPVIAPQSSFEYFSHIIVDGLTTAFSGEFVFENLSTKKLLAAPTNQIILVNDTDQFTVN